MFSETIAQYWYRKLLEEQALRKRMSIWMIEIAMMAFAAGLALGFLLWGLPR
jgi:hypothetical protein